MLLGVRVFVAIVFGLIGLSFFVTTGVLVHEFWDADWLTLATFYSHLFVFFPTFGIVALLAFFTPACVFMDLYWRHVRFGKPRFIFGFVVVAALSWLIAGQLLSSRERSVWEVAPATLVADRGEPPGCATGSGSCLRMPIMQGVANVRAVSQRRIGLSDLTRNCTPDPLVKAAPGVAERQRFCFASTRLEEGSRLATDAQCCDSQRAFAAAVNTLHDAPAQRSLTGAVHPWLLPLKVFFMMILLTISIMLAVWRHSTEKHYQGYLLAIERGVLIGAAAMVMYPIMSHAFLQSANLLYGSYGSGIESAGGYRSTGPYVSLAFGVWGLLLLFFFYRRRDKELQSLARMGGVIGSAVAIVKYDQIIDMSVRFFGSGASLVNLGVSLLAAVLALVLLFPREGVRGKAP